MLAGEAIELAKRWVEEEGSKTSGFCGAHLLGSLNFMEQEAEFPEYIDVDLALVIDREAPQNGVSLPYRGLLRENQELSYQGMIFEIVHLSKNLYSSIEEILSNPTLAHDFARGIILVDPDGLLTDLKETITLEYPRRQWVLVRCADQKMLVLGSIEKLSEAKTSMEAAFLMAWIGKYLASLVAISFLRPVTHRRSLVVMRELLSQEDNLMLYENFLGVLGYAHLTKMQVESYLQFYSEALDLALRVKRSPIPFGFKLEPHVRRYLIDGSREMIEEGYYREAMFWIFIGIFVSNLAVQADAADEDKLHFGSEFMSILRELKFETMEDCETRLGEIKELSEEVFRAVESFIDGNPEITA